MLKIYKEQIERQIAFNNRKNLLSANIKDLFRFEDQTASLAQELRHIDDRNESLLIDLVSDKVLEELYGVNQFFYFDATARERLKNIYATLLCSLKNNSRNGEKLEENHYNRLRDWLIQTNPFSIHVYSMLGNRIDEVICEEYTPLLQLKILGIDTDEINGPVLDIGCGKNGLLVSFLRDIGMEAYGFDRIKTGAEYCSYADWFEYDFGSQKWGMIFSHLGFTNHFQHHHLRVDGMYLDYARTYMQILHSLKQGGTFCYAPGFMPMEKLLDRNTYSIHTSRINGTGYRSTAITKIS